MHSSTGNVAHGKSAMRYAPAAPAPLPLPLLPSLSLSLFLSHFTDISSLPFLPISDIVKLDVSVRRVGGHSNFPRS